MDTSRFEEKNSVALKFFKEQTTAHVKQLLHKSLVVNIGLNSVKVRKIIFLLAWRHETPLKTLNGRGDKKGACRKYD